MNKPDQANNQEKTLLTVYYRVGCHLCEQMTACLRELQSELDFDFERVDIDKNEQLREKYDVDVPVVTMGSGNDGQGGEVVCFHFFEEDMVRQAIEHG